MEGIEIIRPKPYEHVGAEFVLSGRIPKSLLRTSWGGMDYRVLGGFLVVDGFESKDGVDPKIDERHKNIGKKVLQYETDLKNYNKELAEIRKGIVYNKEILEGVFEILDKPESSFATFSESDEDKQEKTLEEKYKDAIEWR